MVKLQIISKIILSKDFSFIENNNLDVEYFVGYEDEFEFIQEHYNKYGTVPDKATFLATFNDFELIDVQETDRYLLDTLKEEYLFYQAVPIVEKCAKLLEKDSNLATEYLLQELPKLQVTNGLDGEDIIANASNRLNAFIERKTNSADWFFRTGLDELDEMINGIQREEELIVIVARTNQGKSWILGKISTQVWQDGYNIGYVSPEMSANSIGYRFDTLYNHFSNSGLTYGKDDINEEQYTQYINELSQNKNKFIVSTPQDFNRKITVSKLKSWIQKYKLDCVAIDGITYMTDERHKKGDTKTTSLTNISEDLISLSVELKIPIIVVVQANRGGAYDKETEGTPELEHIRDSDGIAQNATKVIALRQNDGVLEMGVKKNRFGGNVGNKVTYGWDINTGTYQYIPSLGDHSYKTEKTRQQVREVSRQYNDVEDVF